ncbi:hypothetical protein Acr_11g0002940 [Actinidia rufa]|uniref:RING-type domain-containing protein n=1 Tax=Actinidia rufa TaxID=165716 RepID=A0A7J0FBC3_9ERIC|nr:hypothetical protein Acr_11g0002940 [Actinidia rufa]
MMNNQEWGVATHIIVTAIIVSVILLFICIAVMILIHVCIVGRDFSGGLGNGNMIPTGNFGSKSMSRDDVEKLPCFDFEAREKGSSPVDCAVCLENFEVGDKCRLLPLCNHSFHAQCVDPWLLKRPVCPICRACTNLRDPQTTDRGRLGDAGGEPSQVNQMTLVGSRIGLNATPLHDSA